VHQKNLSIGSLLGLASFSRAIRRNGLRRFSRVIDPREILFEENQSPSTLARQTLFATREN
jgi:hypothetical protein